MAHWPVRFARKKGTLPFCPWMCLSAIWHSESRRHVEETPWRNFCKQPHLDPILYSSRSPILRSLI